MIRHRLKQCRRCGFRGRLPRAARSCPNCGAGRVSLENVGGIPAHRTNKTWQRRNGREPRVGAGR